MTQTAELPATAEFGVRRAAGAGQNSRPTTRAGFAAGGRDGRGAREARYLDTHLATSSQKVYFGDTKTGARIQRNGLRKLVMERVVNSLNRGGEQVEAKRLSCCGSWFKVGRCSAGGQRLEPNPCNSMYCVGCADRKSKRLQESVLKRCHRSAKTFWFLTLTIPNVPFLTREVLERLTCSFAKLRRSAVWARVKMEGGKYVGVTGGVYSLECNFSRKRGDWHPHIHALIEMPKKHPDEWLDALKAEWLRVTGNAKNLHLERVYHVSKRGKKVYSCVNRSALKELVKYVTKAASFADSPERVCEFLRAFRHVRRVQGFGSFVGALKEAEREPGDDGCELKCSCGGSHYHDQFVWSRVPVHISETKTMPDGTRQLKWDFWIDEAGSVEESPPESRLVRQAVERYKQCRIEFSGALPEKAEQHPALFVDAA